MTGWRNTAACLDMDTNDFYPNDVRQLADSRRETRALAACQRCPVAAQCLDDAFTSRDTWGIRGGMTSEERARAVRRGGRAATSPPVDPHQIHEVAALSRNGLTAQAIGRRLGMHPRVVVRYRKLAREES